jgi:hypothetical protein
MRKRINKIDLKKIFMNLQRQMISRLSANSKIINHPTAKGDASELNWIKMLNTYLPKRYKVDKAFVLDHEGILSEQIDLVIYDHQYSPFLFYQDNALYIPSESVYAVFEIKQNINKDVIEYAGKKAESVRKLKRTSASIPHAGGRFAPKKPFKILAGVLSLGCDWKPPFGDGLEHVLNGLKEKQRIDLGCCLRSGGFEAKYNGRYIKLEKSEYNDALIFFFLRLLDRLQKLATVPAMDISKYGKALEKR